jgi:hypothetical protein
MRLTKIIGLLLIGLFIETQSLQAQKPKKVNLKKTDKSIKVVPSTSKNKIALKKASKMSTLVRKQQIKKAVRRSSISRRPIRRR